MKTIGRNWDILLLFFGQFILMIIFFGLIPTIIKTTMVSELIIGVIGAYIIGIIFTILIYKRGKKKHEGELFWFLIYLFDFGIFIIIIPFFLFLAGTGLGTAF